jgi:signal transduction histidine kinase
MKLTARLAVVTLAVTLPIVGAVLWADARARQHAAEDDLAALLESKLADDGGRCAADPRAWSQGPGRPPGAPPPGAPPGAPPGTRHRLPARFMVYDEALRPLTPGAPALPADALQLRAGERRSRSDTWDSLNIEILVRTPWPGRCAFVLARGTKEPWLGALLPDTRVWLAPLVAVLAAVLLVMLPLVRRVRRLTRQVEAAARSNYELQLSEAGDDELGELARAFTRAAGEIHAREKALRAFLADTTHDVMIPLTVLQGHLTALEERPQSAETLAAAKQEAHYIGALLHDLAASARLDAASRHIDEVDLSALVTRVVARHRPIARAREVEVELAVPATPLVVLGDVTLLEQAAGNLVYNAIRHNRPGGHVAVVLEAEEASFRLRVVDDGPGVPAEDLQKLSERGYRSDAARTRSPDGQGLGLDIVAGVARVHGLELTFQASEYGGLEASLAGPTAGGNSAEESRPTSRPERAGGA